MKIKINLLPPQLKAQEVARRQNLQYAALGSIALAVLLILFGSLYTVTTLAKMEAEGLKKERLALEAQTAEYAPYEKMLTKMRKIEGLYDQAVGKSPEWVLLISELGRQAPPDLWLTEITTKAEENGKKAELTIKGWAYDSNAVTEWLQNLIAIEGMKDLSIQFVQEGTFNNSTMVQFDIKATVEGMAKPSTSAQGQVSL
ncbi:PilN domain-containing protein [Heliorestis acidaminivorans]|uniref:PilN domain-containing protein n=1 Tax=Heliorestis acidaminivorans TaxID=553427 RepID=A0A6I0EUF0_9FIRM|nr:PilN domain-containing protein [Heliorestis acidaminivorans]KAB2951313.1 PilN domain-containing protein [Heliorestis acidaminivorans]